MGRDGRGVKPKSASSIQITFQYQGKRCREFISIPPTSANLKRVEALRANILFEIARGTFNYARAFPNSKNAKQLAQTTGEGLRVGVYLEAWFEEKKIELKASTEAEWTRTVRNLLLPQFADIFLIELTRDTIVSWLKSLDIGRKRPMSNKRLANIQTVLRQALAIAVERKLVDVNPLASYTYSRKISVRVDAFDLEALVVKDRVDPFSSEEQAALLCSAEPQMRNYLQFAIWTGLRTSELIALNWDDIDWQAGTVRVWKAMTAEAKGKVETTKTAAGRREVKLLRPALEALAAQKQHTYQAHEAIFHDARTNKRWAGHTKVWDVWQSVIRKAKIRYRNPYQTRHTFASMMLSAGEHPMWVSKQMGHADQTMISRVYGRWMKEADRDAGGRAVAMFSTPATPTTECSQTE
ncbi:tyrosine-type recombinase/integrase [Paraburkholderia elongata]|uniref:DUF3596 domain-containing protein n=1 Tax=Paraburkholderia elongata TaxID=2675747 RepID=A0A972NIN0_9BURK|nr:DUF3596 domain-containing protein [Paraburkholderia elongata]NPT53572.1 DUF3596 domain-containing protein [Paraburkholderia elongata]